MPKLSNPTTCHRCALPILLRETGATGYAIDSKGHHICYECCAIDDLRQLTDSTRWTGYLLTQENGVSLVTNWPGTLKLRAFNVRKSRHACFGRRVDRFDFDFNVNGTIWHGIVRGDMTLARCRKTRGRVFNHQPIPVS